MLYPRHLVFFVLIAVASAANAQPPPGPEEDPPTYDPYPGEPQEDPGSSLDPTFLEYTSQLGEPQESYDGDPSLLDDPNNYPPEMVGTGPSFGLFTVEDAAAQVPDCKTFQRTGRSVTPIGLSASNPRYLSFRGKSNVYVGWSADAACHHKLNNPDFCHAAIDANPAATPPQAAVPANYSELLTKLRGPVASTAPPQLRKLRLWVSLAGDTNPANVPFQTVGDPATATGYWRLDGGADGQGYNHDYFDRLRTVVNKARQLDLVVEITFFAPFQGKPFDGGPWSFAGGHAKALNAQGMLDRVGFSQKEFFVVAGPTDDSVAAARNLRMRDYQRNVILWTIRELWCFENIWYEIANEQEHQTVDPIAVAAWQKTMIDQVEKVEKDYLKTSTNPTGSLQRRHLIAVQPWTATGATLAFQDPRISIVSSHYTTVVTDRLATLPSGTSRALDLGGILLSRAYAFKMRVLGFNETKITPVDGSAGDRSHLNGLLQNNITTPRPDSSRAEAWEFLLGQGGTYDNWSYNSKTGLVSPVTQQIRDQLVKLQAYFDTLPLDKLTLTTPEPPTAWVTNISRYPKDGVPWESNTSSFRYWAGLQTPDWTNGRRYVLYSHHSTPRCRKANSVNGEQDYISTGCPRDAITDLPRFLSFGGYDGRIWTQATKRYKDSFAVNLGASPGSFVVLWIDPASTLQLKQQKVVWKKTDPTCTAPACIVCNSAVNCTLESPAYDFDILLDVAQLP